MNSSRPVVLVLVAILSTVALSTVARSATPSTPAYVHSVTLELPTGTAYEVSCSWQDQVLEGFFMGVASGSGHGWGGTVSGNFDGPLLRFSVNGDRHEVGPQVLPAGPGRFALGARVAGGPGEVHRLIAAWAVWGDPIPCVFTAGGSLYVPKEHPLTSAVRLATSDFDQGVGIDAAGVSAAGAQVFERAAQGHLWASLSGGYGLATADGPEGQHYESIEHPGLELVRRGINLALYSANTNGTWTYRLPIAAGALHGPRLHIINIDFPDAG